MTSNKVDDSSSICTHKSSNSSSSKSSKKSDTVDDLPDANVGFIDIYKNHTSVTEKLWLLIALLCAAGHGIMLPILFVLFGDMTDDYTDAGQLNSCNYNCDTCVEIQVYNGTCDCPSFATGNCPILDFYDEFLPIDTFENNEDLVNVCLIQQNTEECAQLIVDDIRSTFVDSQIEICIKYAGAGLIVLLLGTIHAGTFAYISKKISKDLRKSFFMSLLRQEIGFYDMHLPSEFNARLNDDIYGVKTGTNDKVSSLIQFTVQGVFAIIMGFTHSWKLALMIVAAAPLFMISFGMVFWTVGKVTNGKAKNYEKAGAIADEVITNIRTVQSFGGQQAEIARYTNFAVQAGDYIKRQVVFIGMSIGMMYFTIFMLYAGTFAFGVHLYTIQDLTPGDIMTTLFNVLIGAFSLGQASVNLQYFMEASAAYKRLYSVINRESQIDTFDEKKPDKAPGIDKRGSKISMKDIQFSYPTRKNVSILSGCNLEVQPGETVALVGASGCGKSTIINLIQRLYDPDNGDIYVDDQNIKDVNVSSLRAEIGIVSQEPILFGTTIADNISYWVWLVVLEIVFSLYDTCKCLNVSQLRSPMA